RRLAGETGLFVAVPRAVVARDLRVRTERPGARPPGRRHPAAYPPVGGAAVLDPVDQGAEQVEASRSRSAEAMLEARHHEQAVEVVDFLAVQFDFDRLVIGDAVPGREQGIVPAMIDDQLAA